MALSKVSELRGVYRLDGGLWMRETGEAPVVLQQVSVGGAPPHAVGTYIRMVRWVVPWLRGGGSTAPGCLRML